MKFQLTLFSTVGLLVAQMGVSYADSPDQLVQRSLSQLAAIDSRPLAGLDARHLSSAIQALRTARVQVQLAYGIEPDACSPAKMELAPAGTVCHTWVADWRVDSALYQGVRVYEDLRTGMRVTRPLPGESTQPRSVGRCSAGFHLPTGGYPESGKQEPDFWVLEADGVRDVIAGFDDRGFWSSTIIPDSHSNHNAETYGQGYVSFMPGATEGTVACVSERRSSVAPARSFSAAVQSAFAHVVAIDWHPLSQADQAVFSAAYEGLRQTHEALQTSFAGYLADCSTERMEGKSAGFACHTKSIDWPIDSNWQVQAELFEGRRVYRQLESGLKVAEPLAGSSLLADAVSRCAHAGYRLPSGYDFKDNGKFGFPARDSDLMALEKHGLRSVVPGLAKRWFWASSPWLPYSPEQGTVFYAGNGAVSHFTVSTPNDVLCVSGP